MDTDGLSSPIENKHPQTRLHIVGSQCRLVNPSRGERPVRCFRSTLDLLGMGKGPCNFLSLCQASVLTLRRLGCL